MTSQDPLPQPLISFNSEQASIEAVGGKGANLVKLANAGLLVPNGFLIPTDAYRQFVTQNQLMPQT